MELRQTRSQDAIQGLVALHILDLSQGAAAISRVLLSPEGRQSVREASLSVVTGKVFFVSGFVVCDRIVEQIFITCRLHFLFRHSL